MRESASGARQRAPVENPARPRRPDVRKPTEADHLRRTRTGPGFASRYPCLSPTSRSKCKSKALIKWLVLPPTVHGSVSPASRLARPPLRPGRATRHGLPLGKRSAKAPATRTRRPRGCCRGSEGMSPLAQTRRGVFQCHPLQKSTPSSPAFLLSKRVAGGQRSGSEALG